MNKNDIKSELLLNKGFNSSIDQSVDSPISPENPLIMQIDVFKLQPYDKNPRKARNEKYAEIKESIKNIGLENQFSITKRPTDDYYIIRSGGNTRLKILKELYEETKDNRFRFIECRYVPFTDDLDLLSLHMVENELRGEMLFIDTAFAVKEFKDLLEEYNSNEISYRALTDEMQKKGWKVHSSSISAYLFATLIADCLPKAFASGLGRTNVVEIRKLEDHFIKWAEIKNKDKDEVVNIFRNVLKENDAQKINLAEFEELTIKRLAIKYVLNSRDIRNDVILIKNPEAPILTQGNAGLNEKNLEITNHTPKTELYTTTLQPIDKTPLSMEVTISPDIELSHLPINTVTKQRRELLDYFSFIFRSVNHRFEEIFIQNEEDYLFTIKVEPERLLDGTGKLNTNEMPLETIGLYYALYFRIKMIRSVITFQNEGIATARQEVREIIDHNLLESNKHIQAILPAFSLCTSSQILPEYFQQQFLGFATIEVRQVFNLLPELDKYIKNYLSLFIGSNS